MILERGNMWDVYDHTDLFCITTNSYIRRDGALVMGRGIAKQATERIPDIAHQFGKEIRHLCIYGLVIWKRKPEQSIAAFQVKRHFRSKADTQIISISTTIG